ncbi:branched-chain amino acid ABC transporter permease [Bacillus sp. ISL-39]|uniref:branched-chain amino acid ABC transporter permease n=1 Tax=Bacillus sp. ISL-39 TaxID=2819124 RepID=UPI001BEC91F3|nr:branched-chain amino acid ABC transporter permease [Bacillus sp. ISL-39]MBT2639713.1 branched-chain amino acid ABC transporter permease [Bacillus sp. ISL-39]
MEKIIIGNEASVPMASLSKKRLLFIPLILAALVAFPHIVGSYLTGIFVLIGLYFISTIGISLLMGNAGLVSLAQAAFWGIGAYGSGIMAIKFSVSPFLAIPIGMVLAGVVAYILGYLTRNLQGHYFSLATLGFGIVINIVLIEESQLTGGPSGLIGVPSLGIGSFSIASDTAWFYVVAFISLIVFILTRNLVQSSWGRNLRSIQDSAVASQSMGINIGQYKLTAFVVSAVFAGLSGGLYASYMSFISPAIFSFEMSIKFVVMAVLGGLFSIYGSLIGVIVVTLLVEVLREIVPFVFGESAGGAVEVIFFGLLLVVMMIYMPKGIMGIVEKFNLRIRRGT